MPKGKDQNATQGRARALRLTRILVPTDFSKTSDKALIYALSFASRFGCEITLVHVIEPPPYPQFGYAHIPLQEAKLKKAARKKLAVLCQEATDAGVACASVVRNGSAFHEIVEQAREEDDDLIIISTRGRSALTHLLLGSTAERVVRHARCPVLVVRQNEHEFVIPS